MHDVGGGGSSSVQAWTLHNPIYHNFSAGRQERTRRQLHGLGTVSGLASTLYSRKSHLYSRGRAGPHGT